MNNMMGIYMVDHLVTSMSLFFTSYKSVYQCIKNSRAQHRIIEVSQIFVGSVLAMEMSVKYLKVTISFTKKSVKFSSVFILPQECQLFLGFRQYERKIVKFTARLAWTTIFNKIRQVFSFRSCHLPRLCSSQGQISYKKALEP